MRVRRDVSGIGTIHKAVQLVWSQYLTLWGRDKKVAPDMSIQEVPLSRNRSISTLKHEARTEVLMAENMYPTYDYHKHVLSS